MGDVLLPLGTLTSIVPGMTCTGGRSAVLTIGSVTAWHVWFANFPCSSRQKSEAGFAPDRSLMIRPTTEPATRTFWPTVAVPLFDPTSPSIARTPSRSRMFPRENAAYPKGEVGGSPLWACPTSAHITPTASAATAIVRNIRPSSIPGVTRERGRAPAHQHLPIAPSRGERP